MRCDSTTCLQKVSQTKQLSMFVCMHVMSLNKSLIDLTKINILTNWRLQRASGV